MTKIPSETVENISKTDNGKYLKIKTVDNKIKPIGQEMKSIGKTETVPDDDNEDKIVWIEMKNFAKLPIALLMVKTVSKIQRKKLPTKDKSTKSTTEKVLIVPAPKISDNFFHCLDSDHPILLKLKEKFSNDITKHRNDQSKLFKCKCKKTNEYRIIKVINLKNSRKNLNELALNKELEILNLLKNVRNDFLIRIYDYQIEQHWLLITMEFANGGDLANYLNQHGPLNETLACHWFTQLCQGLSFLHQELKFAHRNIQIENIFLQNKMAKLANFLRAKRSWNEKMEQEILAETDCGQLPYFSPQKIKVQINGLKYNPFADDIWAMGVVLFIMLHNHFPFKQTNNEELLEAQQNYHNYLKQFLIKYPLDLNDFQLKLFTLNEKDRITIDEILCHRWILRKKLPIYFQTKTRPKIFQSIKQTKS